MQLKPWRKLILLFPAGITSQLSAVNYNTGCTKQANAPLSATGKQSSVTNLSLKPPGREKALLVPPSDYWIFKRGINRTALF